MYIYSSHLTASYFQATSVYKSLFANYPLSSRAATVSIDFAQMFYVAYLSCSYILENILLEIRLPSNFHFQNLFQRTF